MPRHLFIVRTLPWETLKITSSAVNEHLFRLNKISYILAGHDMISVRKLSLFRYTLCLKKG